MSAPPIDMANAAIRVVIAVAHAMFRAGLRKLLEAESGFAVIGEAEDGLSAVTLARRLKPDILLLDMAMPEMNGMDVLREFSTYSSGTRTVVLTASIDPSQIAELLQSGATGVLMQTAATEILYKCIRSVAAGQYWVGRDMVGSLVEALHRGQSRNNRSGRPFGLTARELEIVRLVGQGYPNKEVAARLSISEDTVKHHVSKVFEKTGTSTRTELAIFAHYHDLTGWYERA